MILPAYGRDLIELQSSGANVGWLVVSIGWNFGKALPRLVVQPDVSISELDLSMLEGIEITVAHSGEESRALDVAERSLRYGAAKAGVFDMDRGKMTLTTAEVMAIRMREAV